MTTTSELASKLAILIITSMLLGSIAWAEKALTSKSAANEFPRYGQVNYIDHKKRRIVVNDASYGIARNLTVESPSNIRDSFASVQQGEMIGFQPIGEAKGRPTILKIWRVSE